MIDPITVKAHLRVRHSHEDDYIQVLVDAAAQAFNDQTNRVLVDPEVPLPDPVGNALHPTKAIQQGMLLLVGHWYVNREDVVIGTIATALPKATEFLWRPYRWMNVG
ncbi:phage gp6-like head-tail connector protein [Pseudomonas sp. DY-1]|uniref:head-tail connector protein n=1 Tax=Pseudomonas sp. DY-1 TaxID=1755504 RepID=UPI000EAA1F3C|nr:head-tail connector protein [Pseudomonas sp. DY-1]AYF88630.1 phage gp6-like head-tail connector protein [Pseudomonas sp. DY-1]